MEYVYVLEFPDCVKIGYSTRVDSRIRQVEAMVGHKATNVYYMEATRDTENAMHSFFEARRVKGEFYSVPFNEAKYTLIDMIHSPWRYNPEMKARNQAQYIDCLTQFHRWMQYTIPSDKAVVLYVGMLDMSYQNQWGEWMCVNTSQLLSLTHTTNRKVAFAARDKLVEAGFLEYRPGCKGKPTTYKLTIGKTIPPYQ